jgi:hypothetical protein
LGVNPSLAPTPPTWHRLQVLHQCPAVQAQWAKVAHTTTTLRSTTRQQHLDTFAADCSPPHCIDDKL